jgi:flavodoxin I
MSDWEQRIKAAGAELIAPGLLVLGAPDEAMAESCRELGAALAKA